MKIKLFLIGILFILIASIVVLIGILSSFSGFKLDFKFVGFLPVFSSDSQSSLVLIVLVALVILIFIIPILRMFKL